MQMSLLRKSLCHFYRRFLFAHSAPLDETQLQAAAIVFAPHQDDETLGCGGAIIQKKRAGAAVKIVFMTDGSASHRHLMAQAALKRLRVNEALAACQVLGVASSDVIFLDYEDGRLQAEQASAIDTVVAILRHQQPQAVFVPYYRDLTPDHVATNAIVLAAVRQWQQPVTVYEYPVWAWHHWPWVSLPLGRGRGLKTILHHSLQAWFGLRLLRDFRAYMPINEVMAQKRQALEQHRSQMNRPCSHPNWITLHEVSNGEFLDCFFQAGELFRCYQLNPTVVDSYTDQRPVGRVIGSCSPSGLTRQGIDIEGVMAIDHGALRIQPLVKPGWGRAGIAYGPYRRANGLAFAVFMVNGHNTSQVGPLEGIRGRLKRWAVASETAHPARRLFRWARHGDKRIMLRKLRHWIGHQKYFHLPDLNENLAVGWFPHAIPGDPRAEGNAFVVHATGAENGELWARVGAQQQPTVRGLQNIQTYYIVLLRAQGAAYYAAAVPHAHGMVPYPMMRPLAIDPFQADPELYAALYQSVLGQIGFWVDTRVYGAQVAHLQELATWYGTAHVADTLTGSGPLAGSCAATGQRWQQREGDFVRTAQGSKAMAEENLAVLDPGVPAGLLQLLVDLPTAAGAAAGLVWRVQDQDNLWRFQLSVTECQLWLKTAGRWRQVDASQAWHGQAGVVNAVQILDEGPTFNLYLNGQLVFNKPLTDGRLQTATGVGIWGAKGASGLQAFEVHPRSVPIPAALRLGEPWVAAGQCLLVSDDFSGPAGALAGRRTPLGGKLWRKALGSGAIDLTGNGTAKVRASVHAPNPGRLLYTVDWDQSDFADVQVEVTPPGSDRGQGEQGRAGLVFWQDGDHYIIVNTWLNDGYDGASISSFFYLRGFEDLYDAVWTNIGSRVFWGIPYTLRMVFDGMRYTTFVNGEPVLYRALTDVYPELPRLTINRVGIVANWEWGNDTGSVFHHFCAKG